MTSNGPSQHSPAEDDQLRLFISGVTDYAIYMLDARRARRQLERRRRSASRATRADEIIGQHFSRFYTDEDRAAGLPGARAGRPPRDEGKFEAEGWRVRKDGTRFWASVVIDPIRDAGGELIGFAKITRDITERRARRAGAAAKARSASACWCRA